MEQNNDNKVPSAKTYSNSDILEQIKREEERRKKQEKEHDAAVLFALSPFAFAHALRNATSFWQFLLETGGAFVVYFMVFFIFKESYLSLDLETESKVARTLKIIFAYVVSFLVTSSVLR